jgi:hypothetical protein
VSASAFTCLSVNRSVDFGADFSAGPAKVLTDTAKPIAPNARTMREELNVVMATSLSVSKCGLASPDSLVARDTQFSPDSSRLST